MLEGWADPVDVLYATALNMTKENSSNGKVTLRFKHALSQVVFQARKQANSQSISVEVKGMQLYNVNSSGTYTYPAADSENGTWISDWPSMRTINLVSNDPIEVQSGDIITSLSLTNPLLCIPQTLTAWSPSTSNPINDQVDSEAGISDSGQTSFLRIQCKIHDGDHYFVGSEREYGYTYVPFGATWEEGKRYIYTLYFGAGYNANGSEIDIVPITFDAEVTDWGRDNNNDITDF